MFRGRTYDTTLESEGQGCCAVSDLDGTAGVGVVIGHSAEERGRLLTKQKKESLVLVSFKMIIRYDMICGTARSIHCRVAGAIGIGQMIGRMMDLGRIANTEYRNGSLEGG